MPSSRFREMWVTGKIAIDRKLKEEVGEREAKEAAIAISGLIPAPSERLYTDLKSRRGSETGVWLKSLAGTAPKATDEFAHAQATAGDSFDQARAWIDALFHQFAELSITFNENSVGTDLSAECERPQLIETRDEKIWYRPITGRIYQGRISTRYWSEVVRGDAKRICIFVFPAEMTIGFKGGQYSEADMPPFLVAEYTGTGENAWTIQGEGAPLSKVPALAKELFGDLIRVASGSMADSELFNRGKEAPKLGENVAVGYDKNAQEPQQSQVDLRTSTGAHKIETEELNLADACDIVDKVIDKELKALYQEASKAGPGAPQADECRKQISAITNFRMRVVDAFQQYTHDCHAEVAKKPIPLGRDL